ncbi:MAG: 3-phosphoglycerate dehydrogenase [Clostridia bacterium]|nr:3-phosphoglycerate dehydrogenase [Clostridia bacterium]
MNILELNKIAQCGKDIFTDAYTVSSECENPDGIMLRSFNMHEMELPASLKGVARAGAGVNNIPIDRCSEQGIVVFNTPGANANGVKELTIAGLFLACRDIIGGSIWAQSLSDKGAEIAKLVEKGKGQFAGCEISGKKIAVIGLGAIGVLVANAVHTLDMEVIGYDPYISVKSALSLSRAVSVTADLKEAVSDADFITFHLPLNDATRGMINKELLSAAKPGVRILNFSRAELADFDAMKEALADGTVAKYVTDFPVEAMYSMENVVLIPHLGASTEESEDNCAKMAAKQLKDFLETGNIVNSVNFPACEMAFSGQYRAVILHRNVPKMLASYSSMLSDLGVNIDNMLNRSKNEYACTLIDFDADNFDEAAYIKAASDLEGTLSVRIIKR